MIQFKRGKVGNLVPKQYGDMVLKSGQPFFDLTRKKLRIGDGETPLSKLKDVGGLSSEEILAADEEVENNIANIFTDVSGTDIDALKEILGLKNSSGVLFTYGDKIPEKTYDGDKFIPSGQVYLQQYKGAVEADYVTGFGKNTSYYWREWNSGLVECWGPEAFIEDAESYLKETFKAKIIYKQNINTYFELKGFCE